MLRREAPLLALALAALGACATAPASKPASTPAAAVAPDAAGAETHVEVSGEPGLGDLPPLDASFDLAGPPKALVTIGIARPIGAQAAIASAKRLNAYLEPQVGGQVTTRLYSNAAAIGGALASGEIDAAWLTPTAYLAARDKSPIIPIVRFSRGGFTAYRSVFFTKAGMKASKFDELKGKRMGWGAQDSSSARLYPRAHLKGKKIDLAKFFSANLDFADHRAVCDAVARGEVDVGATLSDERGPGEKRMVDGCIAAGLDGAQFKVIEEIGPIPNDVIAVRADLPEAIVSRVRETLLKMGATDEGKAQLKEIFNADGFAPASDDDFTPVRTLRAFMERAPGR